MLHRIAAYIMCALVAMTFSSAAYADNLNRWVRVINDTSTSMMRFHASNEDATSWQEDMLGSQILGPRQSVLVEIDDGSDHCIYDFKAVFSDGAEVKRYNYNVCLQATWTVYD